MAIFVPGAKVKLSVMSYIYNGKAKKPRAKSVVLDSKTLKAFDYMVRCANNKKVGTAATVTGEGNYTGSAKAAFKIKPGKAKKLFASGNERACYAVSSFRDWSRRCRCSRYDLSSKSAAQSSKPCAPSPSTFFASAWAT